MVFITQVNVDALAAHHLRRQERSLQKAVRITLQIHPVFEGAGLALVNVDGHVTRPGLIAHDAPFAPSRKAGPAQTAQARALHGEQHRLGVDTPGHHIGQQTVAPVGAVSVQPHRLRVGRLAPGLWCLRPSWWGHGRLRRSPRCHTGFHCIHSGMNHSTLVHHRHRRGFATPHTRRTQHLNPWVHLRLQLIEQSIGTGHAAREPVTHPKVQARSGLAFIQDVKVVVKTGHLVDL